MRTNLREAILGTVSDTEKTALDDLIAYNFKCLETGEAVDDTKLQRLRNQAIAYLNAGNFQPFIKEDYRSFKVNFELSGMMGLHDICLETDSALEHFRKHHLPKLEASSE